MSVDGYIAGPEGEIDWIIMDPDIDFGALMASFDTLVMGRKTYEATAAYGGGSMPGMKAVIVSNTLRPEDVGDALILSGDLRDAVSRLRSEPGKDIWLFGGGSLFRSLLDLGLVDTVEVAIIPILLGAGKQLLPSGGNRTTLQLVRNRIYERTGTVSLEYAVVHGAART